MYFRLRNCWTVAKCMHPSHAGTSAGRHFAHRSVTAEDYLEPFWHQRRKLTCIFENLCLKYFLCSVCLLWNRRQKVCSFLNLLEEQKQFYFSNFVLLQVLMQLYNCFVDYTKSECCSETDGTSKYLFLIQGNVTLHWLVLLADSTYVCHYCFVGYMQMSWFIKPDGTLEAPVLDPKKYFYFCVVGIAHRHLKCPFSLLLIHSFYTAWLQFSTSCIPDCWRFILPFGRLFVEEVSIFR